MNGDTGNREEMLELVALHALGVLPPAEAAMAAAFVRSDAEARAEWERLRGAADSVGLVAEEPVDSARSARMRERLMTAVRSDVPREAIALAPRRAVARGWLWGAALAAAAAIVFAFATIAQNLALRGDLATAQRRVGTLQDQIARIDAGRAKERVALVDLLAGDAKHFAVPQGEIIERSDRYYLALRSLPPLPRGRVYQAWTLPPGGKTMQPSVTFVPDRSGVAFVALPEHTAAAIAVSVEPEGGSRQPTTQPTFVRPLS